MPPPIGEIETTMQELRLERGHRAFTRKLGHIVGLLGALPDSPPHDFTTEAILRLRELGDETVAEIERRLETGADGEQAQQRLAGTIYEIRRRMEAIERWFNHRESV